ncbi:MAG TPA: hypothetical protein PLQ57_11565 [Saprospiraceae bacterium]|nr:hypothetical protein [Saprospiraceae bacterium]
MKLLNRIIIVYFFILLLLSIYYWLERSVFIDNSFYVFHLVKSSFFSVNHLRIGGLFPQIPALAGIWLGLPLKSVSILFSIGFILYYIGIGYILYKIQSYNWIYVFILSQCLITGHSFFWIASELSPALAFSILTLALIEKRIEGSLQNNLLEFFLPIFFFIGVFFHPLNGIAMVGILIFQLFLKKESWVHYGKYLLSFGSLLLLRMIFIKTPYETGASAGMETFWQNLPNILNLTSTKQMIAHFSGSLFLMPACFVFLIGWYLKQKQFIQLLLVASGVLGMIVLINVNFTHGGEAFYMENLYQVPAFFLAYAIGMGPFKTFETRLTSLFLLGFILIAFSRIVIVSPLYTNRLNWYKGIINKTENLTNKKLIIPKSDLPMDTLLMTWCSAYEIWHLSTMQNAQSRSILLEESDGQLGWIEGDKTKFHTQFENFETNNLDPRYFIFIDTTGYKRYRLK